jgi:hypothetical protein
MRSTLGVEVRQAARPESRWDVSEAQPLYAKRAKKGIANCFTSGARRANQLTVPRTKGPDPDRSLGD